MIQSVMDMNKNLPTRKRLRLKNFDYNSSGAYFLTFCTHDRKNTLAEIVGAIHESPGMQLTAYGKILEDTIRNIPDHFGVSIDCFVIMPNHVHLIVRIENKHNDSCYINMTAASRSVISKVIGYIKMNTSKEIRRKNGNDDVWQRGYYDHVIRDEQDYMMIAQYIDENPKKWELGKLYSV